MDKALISVIVPVYNTADFLSQCLESILRQTYERLEIIVIDDGSVDGSSEIAEEYARKDSRIHFLSQKHQGITSTRIRGIEEANGAWIGFVDSDDYIEGNMYERMLLYAETYSCDLVASGTFIHEINGELRTDFDNYEEGLYKKLSKDIYPTMLHDFRINFKGLRCFLFNKIFRSSVLKSIVHTLDRHVFYEEDAMILYRYCLKCRSIYISKKAYYHYLRRLGSAEQKINLNEAMNFVFLYNNLKAAFEASPDKIPLMRQLRQHILLKEEERILKGIYDVDTTLLDVWDFSAYDKVFGKRILVYGAGKCGQAFYKELLRKGCQDYIVAWVDKKPKEPAAENIHLVEPVDVIRDKAYDYVAVAIKNKKMAQEAITELREQWAVPAEKIVWGESSCRNNWHTAYI